MGEWISASPSLAYAVALFVLPGMFATLAFGLRGLSAIGLAPLISVTLASVGAIGTAFLRLDWSLPAFLAATVLGAVIAFPLGRLARASARRRPSSRAEVIIGVVAAAFGGILVLWAAGRGIGSPDAVTQTYDGVFHLNAIGMGLRTGDISSLGIGVLNHPGVRYAFYPAAFHGFALLVAHLPGVDVPQAANVTALAASAAVWPLGAVLLVRKLVGSSHAGLATAGLLSAGFLPFPYLLLAWGVLWPNLLGVSLLPACLAALVSAVGAGRDDDMGRRSALVMLLLGLPGLGLAHPNAVFSLGVVGVSLVLPASMSALLVRWRDGQRVFVTVTAGIVAALLVPAKWLLSTSSLLASVRHYPRAPLGTMSQAVGEALLNAPDTRATPWAITLLVISGAVLCGRHARTRWVVASWIISILLYGLAKAVDSPLAQSAAGFWFRDHNRLAALVPVLALPLAASAAAALVGWGRRTSMAWGRSPELVLACGFSLILLAVTGGLYLGDHAASIKRQYDVADTTAGGFNLVKDPERSFMESLRTRLPEDAIVANHPWDGSALLPALAGREVLFPTLGGRWDPDRQLVQQSLAQAAVDPRVCSAVKRLGVEYVLDNGPDLYWAGNPGSRDYPGIEAVPGSRGFTPLASGGGVTLYKIAACG